MSLKGVYGTVVGLATIVGTYMYAVDNKWIDDVPDLRVASKTMEHAPSSASKAVALSASSEDDDAKAERRVRAAAKRKLKRARRTRRSKSTVRKRRSTGKRQTVSIFKAAKDIPHPNTQH